MGCRGLGSVLHSRRPRAHPPERVPQRTVELGCSRGTSCAPWAQQHDVAAGDSHSPGNQFTKILPADSIPTAAWEISFSNHVLAIGAFCQGYFKLSWYKPYLISRWFGIGRVRLRVCVSHVRVKYPSPHVFVTLLVYLVRTMLGSLTLPVRRCLNAICFISSSRLPRVPEGIGHPTAAYRRAKSRIDGFSAVAVT